MSKHALIKAIEWSGSQRALARLIGKKQAHVWWWLNRAAHVPAEAALLIEKATDGVVRREDLRPDIFNPPHHSLPSQETKVGS